MHQPSPLKNTGKSPVLQPLTEDCEYEVGMSKHRYKGKIKSSNDKLIQLTGSCQMTPKQVQLLQEAVVLS